MKKRSNYPKVAQPVTDRTAPTHPLFNGDITDIYETVEASDKE